MSSVCAKFKLSVAAFRLATSTYILRIEYRNSVEQDDTRVVPMYNVDAEIRIETARSFDFS